jgi:hypothetical protein
VKVTDCPTFEGLSDDVTVVEVVALSTTCLFGFEVLAIRFVSPPYTAVIEFAPTTSVEVVKVADPSLNVPVPRTVLPFMNETVSQFGGRDLLQS